MPIYLKNIPAKFHPDLTWNDGAGLFWRGYLPNIQQEQQKEEDEYRYAISFRS